MPQDSGFTPPQLESFLHPDACAWSLFHSIGTCTPAQLPRRMCVPQGQDWVLACQWGPGLHAELGIL